MHRFYCILLFCLPAFTISAQNFNYSAAKDSVPWQELNAQNILNTNNSAWNFCYRIPVGFTFHYLGRDFDSLHIETNGYLVFDAERNYAFAAFPGFGDCTDAGGNHSVLGYELSGNAANHILKIQFKNLSNEPGSAKYFSYQVWLRENGDVEVHVGPNNYQPGFVVNTVVVNPQVTLRDTFPVNPDSAQVYQVGLINMYMDTPTKGFFIGDSLQNPQSRPIDDTYPDPLFFVRAPVAGTRFTFTPNFN